jgi:hypothetical protein
VSVFHKSAAVTHPAYSVHLSVKIHSRNGYAIVLAFFWGMRPTQDLMA